MAEITVTARVQPDGTLAIPRKAQESLGLREGDQVEITVNKPDTEVESLGNDPLLAIIGIGKGGPADGAEDHDSKLYRHPSA